jgi:hypothetical protein
MRGDEAALMSPIPRPPGPDDQCVVRLWRPSTGTGAHCSAQRLTGMRFERCDQGRLFRSWQSQRLANVRHQRGRIGKAELGGVANVD